MTTDSIFPSSTPDDQDTAAVARVRRVQLIILGVGSVLALLVDWRVVPAVVLFGLYVYWWDRQLAQMSKPRAAAVVTEGSLRLLRLVRETRPAAPR